MKRGALAMIDALGFKGIWKRYSHETILRKLRALLTVSDKLVTGFASQVAVTVNEPVLASGQVAMLSDTVVVGVAASSPTGDTVAADFGAVAICSLIATAIQNLALQNAPPLVYRGCIALGDFVIDGPFIVGEAVDEAAERQNDAEGAFILLAPTAAGAIDAAVEKFPSHRIVEPWWLRYPVPVKAATPLDAYAVNPFAFPIVDDAEADAMTATVMDFMSGGGSVATKRENTRQFFSDAKAAVRAKRP